MRDKRGQLTVFIIIAIVIVVAVVFYFLLKGSLNQVQIPASLEPAYNSFLSCLQDDALTGVGLLESQAGYIYLPELEIGSQYYPFDSQLVFLGNSIPYWYYVSGNNIQKQQVPDKGEMERQLGRFINERIRGCNFQTYYSQGFVISMEEPNADVRINDNSVDVSLDMDMAIQKGNDTAFIKNHNKAVSTNLGGLYNSARKIYDYEQRSLFLENYSIDALRLYAPVDGLEITCSPKLWSADKVFDDLQTALEQNNLALGSALGNGYYELNASIPEQVRFLNSKTWPSTFEVAPSEESILIASPVGNQEGLGILGFCYVPYHFVYNVRYPVLVQVQKNDETFQFPIAVVIEGNKPRKSLDSSAAEIGIPELCRYKNAEREVHVYDSNLAPVEANISYRCFSETCNIGRTQNGILKGNFPQCVNGYVVAKADGYEKNNVLHSTTSNESIVNLFLEKSHGINIKLSLDNQDYGGNAIITFAKDQSTKTVVYPEQKKIELSQGQYEIQVYIYKNSSLQFPETTKTQCVQVPAGGIGGLIGLTTEKCIDVKIPSQIISSALAGGGKQNYYALESELASAANVEISAESLPTPASLEQLQNNFILFEDKKLDISFK